MYRILFSFLFSTVAVAATVNLEWNAVSDTDADGYRIGYGPASQTYIEYVDILAPATQAVLQVSDTGQTFINVRAFTNQDPYRASDWSNEVVYGQSPGPNRPLDQIALWASFEHTGAGAPPMAEIIRYVDPDATGVADGTSWADAYASLFDWEAAEQTNLVSDGDWHHVYVRSSGGTADTTEFDINGWTTGASNNIVIEAASGDEALKTGWDTSRYRLEVTDPSNYGAINIRESYVNVIGLQIRNIYSSVTYQYIASVYDWDGGGTVLFDSCRFEASGGSSNGIRSQCSASVQNTVVIQNSIVIATHNGIHSQSSAYEIYNTVIRGDGQNNGYQDGGTSPDATITNSALFNFNNDVLLSSGTATITNTASDDGDGTNSISPNGSDWDNEFSDPANGDFTLLNTGNLYHGGVTISGGPAVDIEGDTWHATTPSVGVDEYLGGVASLPITLGGQQIESVHLGSTEISEIHFGSTQLWP